MSGIESIESIPNPGRTIEGLRDTGYNFETAVADLVDNSIAAGATKVSVQVKHDFRGNVRLSIDDDGCGMGRQGLVHAMQYGSPKRPDPASLGKYGLGLKTASTAFCRRLSLMSRPSGDSPALMATWDLDHVVEEQQWLLQMSDEPEEEALEHLEEVAAGSSGTVVLWNKVDRLLRDYQDPAGGHARRALTKRCRDLREHIAMTYQRFLDKSDGRARNVEITVNGEPVAPWDPFQKSLSELVAEEAVEVEGTGAKFRVRAYILPRREEFGTAAGSPSHTEAAALAFPLLLFLPHLLLDGLAQDAFPFLALVPQHPVQLRRQGVQLRLQAGLVREVRGEVLLPLQDLARAQDRVPGPDFPSPVTLLFHDRPAAGQEDLALGAAVPQLLRHVPEPLLPFGHAIAQLMLAAHEPRRGVVPDAECPGGYQPAGALVFGQEEAVAAGLPNPVIQGLPGAYRHCRQVVEKCGPLDAGDGTLDR